MLFIIYLAYIFLIQPLLETRAEIQKCFRWFFGSDEKFRIGFRDYLTFRQGLTSSVWFSITKRKTRNRMLLINYKENSPPCVWHIQQKGLRTSLHPKWGQSLFEFELISKFMFTNLQKIDKLLLFHETKN